jgi:actin
MDSKQAASSGANNPNTANIVNINASNTLSSSNNEPAVVILDLGSGFIKAGFSGQDSPLCCLPCVLIDNHSQPQSADAILELQNDSNEFTIGNKALQLLQNSLLSTPPNPLNKSPAAQSSNNFIHSSTVIRPINGAEITDWHALKCLLEHIFKNELHINPKDHSVLLAVQTNSSQTQLLAIAKLLFQTFQIPSLLLVNSSVLSLYSTGRTTGLVIEVGECLSSVTPVFEGFPIKHAILTSKAAGRDVTKALCNELESRGVKFNENQLDVVRDIKEKLCRVRPRPKNLQGSSSSASLAASSSNDDSSYELPDGRMINLDEDCRHNCLELLFTDRENEAPSQPNNRCSISRLIYDCLCMLDQQLASELIRNVVLAGGCTCVLGFAERIKWEVNNLLQQGALQHNYNSFYNNLSNNLIVVTDSQRRLGSWIGGSMLASLATFPLLRCTAEQFKRDENNILKKYF